MTIQTEDIVNKEFSRSFLGYDMQEVDVFLDSVIDRMETMERERDELAAAMEKLLKRVERLEKAKGSAAVEGGESAQRKLPPSQAAAPVASGPVHVQGGKTGAESANEEAPARREHTALPQKQRSQTTGKKEAPAYAKPIRPAAQPQPAQEPQIPASPQPAPETHIPASPQPVSPVAPQIAQSAPTAVAIEMETGIPVPDGSELLPDLINDMESAVLDGSILPASRKDAPVRAADQSRVS